MVTWLCIELNETSCRQLRQCKSCYVITVRQATYATTTNEAQEAQTGLKKQKPKLGFKYVWVWMQMIWGLRQIFNMQTNPEHRKTVISPLSEVSQWVKISCICTALDEVVKPSALPGPDSHYREKCRDTAQDLPKAYAEYESGLKRAAYWLWDLSESLRTRERSRAAAGSEWEANRSARATRRMYIKLYYRNNFKLIGRDINNSLTAAPSEIKLWLRWGLNDEVCVCVSATLTQPEITGWIFRVILSFSEEGRKKTQKPREVAAEEDIHY